MGFMIIIGRMWLLEILCIVSVLSALLVMAGFHLYDFLPRKIWQRLLLGTGLTVVFVIFYIAFLGLVLDKWVISVEVIRLLG